jgi:hypothetical protein
MLSFGNPGALHRHGESPIKERNDIRMRPSARQKPLMETLVCVILFVAGGWLLRSEPMCDWKAKRQRISKRKEAVMARIIEFYVPAKFQRREPLTARSQKGKVIVFCAEAKKPA